MSPTAPINPRSFAADRVTTSLLARYDQPGPRYTSYPTAVEFHEGLDDAEYGRRLEIANRGGEAPLSIYVHLPFCKERCLFCACNVIISPHVERAKPYLDLLQREIEMIAERLPQRRRLAQLHLGGGTPTYYEPEELKALVDSLLSRFEPLADAELAIEVDPRVTSNAHIDVLAEVGFNRLSLGLQDLEPRVQEAIHRVQSLEDTTRIIERARSLGFRGLNVDLIYGLPFQTRSSFEDTVAAVIDMKVDRAAVYSFAYVPNVGAQQKRLPEDALPTRDEKFSLYAVARRRFLDAGYETIGMDHFALPDDELAVAKRERRLHRNFQGYTVMPGADVIGLGISAIGDVAGAYVQNHKKLSRYQSAIEAGRLPVQRGIARTPDDEARKQVIQQLMCNFRVDYRLVEKEHGLRFAEYFAEDLDRLSKHQDHDMVRIRRDSIEVTATGELFVRNLARCFDLYWRQRHEGQSAPVFSRTV